MLFAGSACAVLRWALGYADDYAPASVVVSDAPRVPWCRMLTPLKWLALDGLEIAVACALAVLPGSVRHALELDHARLRWAIAYAKAVARARGKL